MKVQLSDVEIHKVSSKCKNICCVMLEDFIKKIKNSDTISETDKRTILDILNTQVYFVGGLWRSMFTNGTFNDVDVAFRSLRASDTLRTFALKYPFLLNITSNFNAYHHGVEDLTLGIQLLHRLSFDFAFCGTPEEVLNTFDFSFNQNFYDPFSGGIQINKTVFSKMGVYNTYCNDPAKARITLKRMLRFVSEGFSFSEGSVVNLYNSLLDGKNVFNLNVPNRTGVSDESAKPCGVVPQLTADKINKKFRHYSNDFRGF